MLELDGLLGLITIGLWVFCFIDVLLTPDGEQRNLPKLAWVFLVLLFPLIGAIAWLVAGKNYGTGAGWSTSSARSARSAQTAATPTNRDYTRSARPMPTNPDDDEEFLASLRRRAEQQRQRAREQGEKKPDGEPTEPGA